MGGLGESHHGIGINQGVMAYFTVSTGVNGVRLVNGVVDNTIERYEIGEQLIAGVDGRLHNLESLTGGGAFERRRGRAPKEVRDASVWATEARNLAVGIYNTILFWNPAVIVFNGSMMRDIDLKAVRAELEEWPQVMPEWPRLAYAKLGDAAGIYGAMVLLRQQKGKPASKPSVR
jgi:predicted NBD/HSP70 family sugar kinase